MRKSENSKIKAIKTKIDGKAAHKPFGNGNDNGNGNGNSHGINALYCVNIWARHTFTHSLSQ